jgi:hypothetical protein
MDMLARLELVAEMMVPDFVSDRKTTAHEVMAPLYADRCDLVLRDEQARDVVPKARLNDSNSKGFRDTYNVDRRFRDPEPLN